MVRKFIVAVIALALFGIGWVAGMAQTPLATLSDFELIVDSPPGPGGTIVRCVRGCNFEVGADRRMDNFAIQCADVGAGGRCKSGPVRGFLIR
jgi:hypothetical protein